MVELNITVKGWLELSRDYDQQAENVKEAANRIGGSWFDDWDKYHSKANECRRKAVEMLGDWELLPEQDKIADIPF
jgi:hypothetical protein